MRRGSDYGCDFEQEKRQYPDRWWRQCRSCFDVIEVEGRFAVRGILDANESLSYLILTHDLLGKEGTFKN